MQVLFEVHRQKLRVTWQVSGGKTSALDPGLDGSRRHAEYIGDVFNTGQCQVLCWNQVCLLAMRRLDSSVAISIQRSTSVFMTS
jgi:hypothetical protein